MSHRIEVRTTDELGVLAENINEMAERLQHSVEEERKAVNAKNDLITGVSHDLRTPLPLSSVFWNISSKIDARKK